jgi:DNA-binding NarL/FixJ family response regulator
MENINVAIIEDDKVIHESLVQSINMYPAMNLSWDAYSVEEALECIGKSKTPIPDVILLDIGLPGMSGLDGIPHIKKSLDNSDIIMLTTYDESEIIFKALCSGACSYISKKTSLKVIMDSIFTVYRGGSYMSPTIARKIAQHFAPLKKPESENHHSLTQRQLEIVKHLSQGLSYKMIGDTMSISIDTVRSHIKKIYKALEVNNKLAVIDMYREGRI